MNFALIAGVAFCGAQEISGDEGKALLPRAFVSVATGGGDK